MQQYTLQELQPLIIQWAKDKNITGLECVPKQKLKFLEESGELAAAILKNKIGVQQDAIGDIFVVLIILNYQLAATVDFDVIGGNIQPIEYIMYSLISLVFEEDCRVYTFVDILNDICIVLGQDLTFCANIAWNEIKDRKGETINGTFIRTT